MGQLKIDLNEPETKTTSRSRVSEPTLEPSDCPRHGGVVAIALSGGRGGAEVWACPTCSYFLGWKAHAREMRKRKG